MTVASRFSKEVGAAGSIPQLDSRQKHLSSLGKVAESGERQIRGHHCHLLALGCGAGTFTHLTEENHKCGKVPALARVERGVFFLSAGSQLCNLEQLV